MRERAESARRPLPRRKHSRQPAAPRLRAPSRWSRSEASQRRGDPEGIADKHAAPGRTQATAERRIAPASDSLPFRVADHPSAGVDQRQPQRRRAVLVQNRRDDLVLALAQQSTATSARAACFQLAASSSRHALAVQPHRRSDERPARSSVASERHGIQRESPSESPPPSRIAGRDIHRCRTWDTRSIAPVPRFRSGTARPDRASRRTPATRLAPRAGRRPPAQNQPPPGVQRARAHPVKAVGRGGGIRTHDADLPKIRL